MKSKLLSWRKSSIDFLERSVSKNNGLNSDGINSLLITLLWPFSQNIVLIICVISYNILVLQIYNIYTINKAKIPTPVYAFTAINSVFGELTLLTPNKICSSKMDCNAGKMRKLRYIYVTKKKIFWDRYLGT